MELEWCDGVGAGGEGGDFDARVLNRTITH